MHFMKEFPPDTLQYAHFFYADAPDRRFAKNHFVKPANDCARNLVVFCYKSEVILTEEVLDNLQELGIICSVREENEPLSKAVVLTKPKKYNLK